MSKKQQQVPVNKLKASEGNTTVRTIRVPDNNWLRWQTVSAIYGLTISEWLRQMADEACELHYAQQKLSGRTQK